MGREDREPGGLTGLGRRRFRIARRAVGARLLPWFGPPALAALKRTWRASFRGTEHLAALDGGAFIALWHGRMLPALPFHADRGWHVLVSPSDDGGLVKLLLDRHGYVVVRGSSSRGGARAVRAMLTAIEARTTVVVITPDGPRGPRHSMNPGLAWLARATGRPVLPLGIACDRAWRSRRSWDRFVIPKLGARLELVYGEPLSVPPTATDEDLTAATETLRERLLGAERAGFAALGVESDH